MVGLKIRIKINDRINRFSDFFKLINTKNYRKLLVLFKSSKVFETSTTFLRT